MATFIPIHQKHGGELRWINFDCVESFSAMSSGGSALFYKQSERYPGEETCEADLFVTETPEELAAMLKAPLDPK